MTLDEVKKYVTMSTLRGGIAVFHYHPGYNAPFEVERKTKVHGITRYWLRVLLVDDDEIIAYEEDMFRDHIKVYPLNCPRADRWLNNLKFGYYSEDKPTDFETKETYTFKNDKR